MIEQFEHNEFEFTSYWSRKKEIDDGGIIFLNPKLNVDFFFNKVTCIGYNSEETVKEALREFEMNNLQPCFYVIEGESEDLKRTLLSKGLIHYDTMHVLKRKPYASNSTFNNISRVRKESASLWSDIFCRAYECPSWKDEVTRIIRTSSDNVYYFADIKNQSCCVALYSTGDIVGLYCLGTVPSLRGQGHARHMVEFAVGFVLQHRLDWLVLATFESDGLLDFYDKLGFDEIYTKELFAIPNIEAS